jgi:hypothetical protein
MNQITKSRIQRAFTQRNPENPRTKTVDVEVSTNQMHPVTGSAAIRSLVGRGTQIFTFNVINAAGFRKALYGEAGFGYGAVYE